MNNYDSLYKKLFPLALTKQFYIWTIILTLIPMLILAVLIPITTYRNIKVEKEKELFTVIGKLNTKIRTNYNSILETFDAEGKSVEEQTKVLNSVLQPVVNEVTKEFPDVEMGYYSINLDYVLAINPAIKPFKLLRISHDNPYFHIYKTGQPEFGSRNISTEGSAKQEFWYAYPLWRNGKIIGHTWANVKNETIYSKVLNKTFSILAIWLLTSLTLLVMSYLIFKKIRQGLEQFAKAVLTGKEMTETDLPELKPILELVKQHNLTLQEQAVALSASEEKFAKAFNASPAAMAIVRLSDGVYLDVNKKFEQMTGNSREDIIGQTSLQFDLWVDKKIREEFYKDLKEVGYYENFETIIRHKSGETRIVMVVFEVTQLKEDDVTLCMFNDITQVKLYEKEMIRLGYLNLIGEMSAGISHEIRNPLTTVRGFLQMLEGKTNDTQTKEYYHLMIEELDRANSIISEFLSLAKNKVVTLEQRNLNSIVNSIYPMILADALTQDKNIILQLEHIQDLLVDEKEIRQLILNLVRNGLEAMPAQGSLTIATFSDVGEVVLSVQDQGRGIDIEILEKLGTPFLTTKDNGTGLGLAVCYSIANRHNAKIDFKTGPDGTVFFIRFYIDKFIKLKKLT